MAILSRKETKYIGKPDKLIAKKDRLKEEIPELRKAIRILQTNLRNKEVQMRNVKNKILDRAKVKGATLEGQSPEDSLVMIDGCDYKIGLHGKAYVHDNTEWILSSKSVEEIEAAIG